MIHTILYDHSNPYNHSYQCLDPVETGNAREQVRVDDTLVLDVNFGKVLEDGDSQPLTVGTVDKEEDRWVVMVVVEDRLAACFYCSNPHHWKYRCEDITASSVPGTCLLHLG